MSSQIDTSNINRVFPVQGVDNSSQGFRDNFGNIASQLDIAASEITDLQESSSVLTVATTGTLGGIIVGNGLGIDNGGVVSVIKGGAMNIANAGSATNVPEIVITGLDFSKYHYDLEFSGTIIGNGAPGWITVQIGDSATPTNWNTTAEFFAYAYGNVVGSPSSYTANGTFGIATTRSSSQPNVLGTARIRSDVTGGIDALVVQWAGAFWEVGGTYDCTPGMTIGALRIGSTMGNFSGTYTLYEISRS